VTQRAPWRSLAFCTLLLLASSAASPEPAPRVDAPRVKAPRVERSVQQLLRQPREFTERARSITLIAGGDVSFGRKFGQRLLRDANFDPFRSISPLLHAGDLRFVNLESVLSDQGGETEHPVRPLTFVGPPSAALGLARAGIELVSVANNHAWDYGKSAFLESLEHLTRAGVAYTGGAGSEGDAFEPRRVAIRGWSTAWFAVTDIWNRGIEGEPEAEPHVAFARTGAVIGAIERARSKFDLVIVSYHGGCEYSEHIAREQRAFARAAMAAGADAVIGHHPHVPQGVEWFEERPVLYSLGNLVFNQHRDHAWTGRGFLARMTLVRNERMRLELCPYRITEEGPVAAFADTPPDFGVYERYLRRVTAYAGFSDIAAPDAQGCMQVSPQ
jgi:poly-gamma-glutamate capsule biosynthesis protein CapA/YwtB (metallophosphatase superfamily)